MKQLYRAFRVQQLATKVDQPLFFHCGFTPLVVKGYSMDSGGRDFIAVRGLTADGEVVVRANDGTAKDEDDSNNGISFEEQGFSMKSHTLILDRNSGLFFVEAYGDLVEGDVVTVSADLPTRDDDPYGEGKQYTPNINPDLSGSYNPEFSDAGIYKDA